MDDIDREIKQIQLQRERLALERDLALTNAGVAAGAVAGGLMMPFRLLGRFLLRWWKAMLLLVVITAAVSGAIVWKEKYDDDKREAIKTVRLQRWDFERTVFMGKECPESNFSCSLAGSSDPSMQDLICSRRDLDRLKCQSRAIEEYGRRSPFKY